MIYGFLGKILSGKTTACARLIFNDNTFVKVGFKDGLVREMKERLPDVLEALAGMYFCSVDQLFINKQPIMRELMQNYGTEVRRADDPNYWVHQWCEATLAAEPYNIVVVDDVRFVNEAQAIRDMGGMLIRLVKVGSVDVSYTHASEMEMEGIVPDVIVQSLAGRVEDMHMQVKRIINK